jgi:hypothetical protein
MGGQLLGGAVDEEANKGLDYMTPIELNSPMGLSPHSGINKVMYASAVHPLAFARLGHEPFLDLQSC